MFWDYTIIALGIIWLLALVFCLALCRIAAQADRHLEQARRAQEDESC